MSWTYNDAMEKAVEKALVKSLIKQSHPNPNESVRSLLPFFLDHIAEQVVAEYFESQKK